MEGKEATSVMKLKEKYYKQIGSTRSSLRWADILFKLNIKITQAMWKELNSFVHPLLPNCLGVNEYNMLRTSIYEKLNLWTKYVRKGNKQPMKETE